MIYSNNSFKIHRNQTYTSPYHFIYHIISITNINIYININKSLTNKEKC